jgi:hypothetical protein
MVQFHFGPALLRLASPQNQVGDLTNPNFGLVVFPQLSALPQFGTIPDLTRKPKNQQRLSKYSPADGGVRFSDRELHLWGPRGGCEERPGASHSPWA